MSSRNDNYARHLEYIARAYDLERLQRYELALQEVQRALDLELHSAQAHVCKAWILRQYGRIEEAEEAVRTALSFEPALAAAYNVLACILWSGGKLLDAEQAFEAALSLQGPDTARYMVNYARLVLVRRRLKEALELADGALRRSPSLSIGYEVRGEALRMLGRDDEAVSALLSALRLNPLNARVHNSLGHAQLAQGDVAGAQDSFREALRLQPGDREAQSSLVVALGAQYPLYGRLLTFKAGAKSTRGRANILRATFIALGLVIFLPVTGGVVFGFARQDMINLWLLLMEIAFGVPLLALVGWLLGEPLSNLLLRLDARNRAVVPFGASEVVGIGLRLVSTVALFTSIWGVILLGPNDIGGVAALYIFTVSISGVLLLGGTRRLKMATKLQRWAIWGSYSVAIVSAYVVAIGAYLYPSVGTGWAMAPCVVGLGLYLWLWARRALDTRRVPAKARRALGQWLLFRAASIVVGIVTCLNLGMSLYWAVIVTVQVTFICLLVTSHSTTHRTRIYRRWVTMWGQAGTEKRVNFVFMGLNVCLAAFALAFHYLK